VYVWTYTNDLAGVADGAFDSAPAIACECECVYVYVRACRCVCA